MPGDTLHQDEQQQSLSEVWSARYDDRDDEELACHVWAQELALRDHAMANPIKAFEMPAASDPPAAPTKDSPSR